MENLAYVFVQFVVQVQASAAVTPTTQATVAPPRYIIFVETCLGGRNGRWGYVLGKLRLFIHFEAF